MIQKLRRRIADMTWITMVFVLTVILLLGCYAAYKTCERMVDMALEDVAGSISGESMVEVGEGFFARGIAVEQEDLLAVVDMPKETFMRKDTTFSIRISKEDLELIKQNAKKARMSQSDYVTHCCLGRQIVVIEGLKDLAKELRAIGNNLNQLTALANMKQITVVYLDKVAEGLANISAAVRALQEYRRW